MTDVPGAARESSEFGWNRRRAIRGARRQRGVEETGTIDPGEQEHGGDGELDGVGDRADPDVVLHEPTNA